jgi:hypothetical protein
MGFYEDASTALKETLESVSGIGVVHATHRYTRTPEGFRDYFTALIQSGQPSYVHTWLIHRDGFSQTDDRQATGHEQRAHRFVIDGYWGICESDGSELAFQEILDDIADALSVHKKLSLSTVEFVRPPQIISIDHQFLGPVLCHHARIEIELLARHKISYQP